MISIRITGRRRGSVLAAGFSVAGAGLIWLSLPQPPPALPTAASMASNIGSPALPSTDPPVSTSVSPVSTSPASTLADPASPAAAPVAPPPKASLVPGGVQNLTQGSNAADPARITIPAIDVDSTIVDLGLAPDRSLQTPTDFATAGWFTGGPAPGATGPAVIAGHVDSVDGPAVFYRLGEIRVGDLITVRGQDATDITFAVDDVRQYAKDTFPATDVYRWTPQPTLRLITCGGDFDRSTGHYRDNIVVFATRTA